MKKHQKKLSCTGRTLLIAIATIVIIGTTGVALLGCEASDTIMELPETTDEITNGRQTVSSPEDYAACEITDIDNWIVTDSLGSHYMMGAVCVKNTGTVNVFLRSGTFDIEDTSGALIDSHSYISVTPQIIAPGETAVYFGEMSFDKGDASGDYIIIPTLNAEVSMVDLIRCPVTDVTFSDDRFGGVEVVGRVENTTDKEQSMLNVSIILYDNDGNVLSVIETYADTVAPGAKIGFSASTFYQRDLKVSDIASYKAYAYPTQYNF